MGQTFYPMGQTFLSDGTNLFIRWDKPFYPMGQTFYPVGQTFLSDGTNLFYPMGQTFLSDGTNLFIRWDKHFYPVVQGFSFFLFFLYARAAARCFKKCARGALRAWPRSRMGPLGVSPGA